MYSFYLKSFINLSCDFINLLCKLGTSEVKLSSNRDLTALKLTDVDYQIVDRVYDQPESQKTIRVEQNIAYGEVHPEK